MASIVQLRCGIKNDGWGKKGKDSLASRLWSKTPGNGPIDENQTYSEMWMGTYPSNPSYVFTTDESLAEYIKRNPQLIGRTILDRWGAEIPFLPKILSFSKALTLQIHPDKRLAEKLHALDPTKFGDSNHKPEIAVALSKFELFVGWKALSDIQAVFQLKPLRRFVQTHSSFTNETVRSLCKELLTATPDTVKEVIEELQSVPEDQFGQYTYIPSMLSRLSKQYTEFDNGILVAVLLMNYMTLEPGEAVCVPADSIHAYLHGDIVECMARSDNVINTGFCPQAQRDSVDLFTQALTFHPHSAGEAKLPGRKTERGTNGKTVEYAPPFSEFNVLSTSLNGGDIEIHQPIAGPSLLIITSGLGSIRASDEMVDVSEGQVFFIGQGVQLEFSTVEGMDVYRAYAE